MFDIIFFDIIMVNPWILHVKQFAKKNNLQYGCAISNPECAKEYKMNKGKVKDDEAVKLRKDLTKLLKRQNIYFEEKDSIEKLRKRYAEGRIIRK
jgi:predicted metal-binding transcription factor (methanogenesis marker protein 9)